MGPPKTPKKARTWQGNIKDETGTLIVEMNNSFIADNGAYVVCRFCRSSGGLSLFLH